MKTCSAIYLIISVYGLSEPHGLLRLFSASAEAWLHAQIHRPSIKIEEGPGFNHPNIERYFEPSNKDLGVMRATLSKATVLKIKQL